MKNLFFLLGVCWAISLQGQDNVDHNPDPKAKAILQELSNHLSTFSDLNYQFRFTIVYPESDADDIIEGRYIQKGDQYRLETPTHYFICDTKNKWVVDLKGKEIQIHDYVASTGGDISDPQSLLNIYTNPNYDYRFVFDGEQDGKEVQIIEFKPIERGNEMTKAILTIDRPNHQIHTMEVFNRDGSRLHLLIQSVETNTNPTADAFIVSDEQFPNFYIEDLRIE